MDNEDNKFTHIGVKKLTQRKVSILASVLDDADMYSLVEFWADSAWQSALDAGLVTNAMLKQDKTAHVIGKPLMPKKFGKRVTA